MVLAKLEKLGRLIEDAALVILLAVLITTAASQIVMRNLLGSGFIWADEFLRILVLWLALLGAVAASRDDKQINIDVLSRFLPPAGKLAALVAVDLFTAAVCGVAAWYSLMFVADAYEYGDEILGSQPAWIFQSIIPVAFGLIAYRYLLFFFKRLTALFNREFDA